LEGFPVRSLLHLLLLALLLMAPSVANAQPGSWAGKSVFQKQGRTTVTYSDERGVERTTHLDLISYRAVDDQNGMVQLQTRKGQMLWVDKKYFVSLDEAVPFFTQQLQQNPQDSSAFQRRASAYILKKDFDAALRDLDQAIRLQPGGAHLLNSRGILWNQKKEYDKAIDDFTEAIKRNPNHVFALVNRALAWRNKKQYDKSIADYEHAIQLDPNYSVPYNGLGWFLATSPEAKYRDGKRAVELTRKACELTQWKDMNYIDTLAAAYAESGQFPEALRYQEMALKDAGFKREFGKVGHYRLELYRKKQAYRLGMENPPPEKNVDAPQK
jgi:tetratricopeptide (TPR) repeat protein